MEITRNLFDEQRRPRFGRANPERMRLAFWEWMIRGDDQTPSELTGPLGRSGWRVRDGKLKSGYGPWRARERFKVPTNRAEGPIWTFERMGRTSTELADGRVICIAGEHEDSYDPDFCIYNDVVVFTADNDIEIYGYPKDVLPPTDFHTATLVGEEIIVIGCLGYPEDRRPGQTPVYRLDQSDYRISKMETSGDAPGWIFQHEANLDAGGVITIRGGDVEVIVAGNHRHRRNVEDFALDTRSGVWRQVTNRNWRQFSIRQADNKLFVLERDVKPDQLFPAGVGRVALPDEEWYVAEFLVDGVRVSLTVDVSDVRVIIEGALPGDLAARMADEIRAKAEAAIQRPCVLDQL
jgi:hypothetical protein